MLTVDWQPYTLTVQLVTEPLPVPARSRMNKQQINTVI